MDLQQLMDIQRFRIKLQSLLASDPETPYGEILSIDNTYEPYGLQVTVPTLIPGIKHVHEITIREK